MTTTLMKTAQIFTVDPKRPAAGTINSTIDFGGVNGQYLDKVAYKVDDQTIEAITGLIGKVAPQGLIGSPTTDQEDEDVERYLRDYQSVVASGIFSLDAPDLELQIAEFLNTHLNHCHTCQVVPAGVQTPKRLASFVEDPCVHGAPTAQCPSCKSH
ncbi:MAG: hypothetical protein MI861_09310 [Pirellulales bacterium]|nr:hypothetical protein [Pirellulales bacterium]